MAQGAGKLKGGKASSAGSSRKKSGVTRPGKFTVAPKTQAKISAKSQEKVCNSPRRRCRRRGAGVVLLEYDSGMGE